MDKKDTSHIQTDYPLTWNYLLSNADAFKNRKSVVFNDSIPFNMFAVGSYSFAEYKVTLSCFYEKPLFCLLYGAKPVITDNTVYFLSFDEYDIAYSVMLLLNSTNVQDYLLSIAALGKQRIYTIKLLSELDLMKCLSCVSFEDMLSTENSLELPPYITEDKYSHLTEYIKQCSLPENVE